MQIETLERSIDALTLPARMASYAARKGLLTIGDLVRQHPAALLLERNLGRRTIAQTRLVLEGVLGSSWEDYAVASGHVADEGVDAEPRSGLRSWADLRGALDESLQSRPLDLVALPARVLTYAKSRGLTRLGELLAVPESELLVAPNLGRRSIVDARATIARLADGLSGPARASDWRPLVLDAIGRRSALERMVLTQRSGLVLPRPTLQETGEMFGFSRERARQLESKAVDTLRRESAWIESLAAAMHAALPPFVAPLADLRDGDAPLVADVEADAELFAFVLESILTGDLHAFEHEGTWFAGRVSRTDFTTKLTRLRRACDMVVLPLDEAGFAERLGAIAELASDELAVLYDRVRDDFRVEAGRVVGYGAQRDARVLAFLRAAGAPVPIVAVERACGRAAGLPEGVVWLDRGIVTLAELVPGFDTWKTRLGPLVATLIAEHGEHRQWTTAELLPLLEMVADLPEWMNPHALGSLLRDAPELTYLGRNVVALPRSANHERAHVQDILEAILEAAGEPLPQAEVLKRARERRGLSDTTWNMQRMRPPFVLFGADRIGLAPRDVPGGADACEPFREHLYTWLEARERGCGSAELLELLAERGEPWASWDIRLARSILRHDPRFRLALGGGVGLAAWGGTRTRNQGQVLEDLLGSEGRVSVADAAAALPTASGEPMTRVRIGLLARTVGARLQGDDIVRAAAAPEPEDRASDVAQWGAIPEKALPTFLDALREPRELEALLTALGEWRCAMLAVEDPAVDKDQVRQLATRATAMLTNVPSAPEGERAVRAAVEYLVCVADGESDLVVGGLDDDEAVLDVVERVVRGAGKGHTS